ncbi:hypothetical protein V8G54_002953 [Vigna mungo]|uniref:Uncharacterized protein n=1 Tax=Vigna mungo TaxID=3915 RepID=A0AAQ3SDJ8_VIGMU
MQDIAPLHHNFHQFSIIHEMNKIESRLSASTSVVNITDNLLSVLKESIVIPECYLTCLKWKQIDFDNKSFACQNIIVTYHISFHWGTICKDFKPKVIRHLKRTFSNLKISNE